MNTSGRPLDKLDFELSLGELIKEARKIKSKITSKRYTQDMLSKDIGASRSYIGDIEYGRFLPSYESLIKISEACNVPFSFFAILEEHIKKHIEIKFPNSDLTKDNGVINFYKNHAGNKHSQEFLIKDFYNAKKLEDYANSFEEFSTTTVDRVPHLIHDPGKKIELHKTLNPDSYFGEIPIGHIVFEYDLDPNYDYSLFLVADDSMNLSKIGKEDLVIIQRQNNVENGDIIAIKINNTEDVIRRVYLSNTTITLIPNSSISTYEPITIDISAIQIIGKVVRAITKIQGG